MADNEIVYEVKANTKGVDSALKNIDKKAAEVGGDGGGFASITSSISSLGTAAIAAGAAIATYLVGQGLSAAISEAITAEDSINRMNQALNNAGRLSQSSSDDFKKFASELQGITTYGDDATMQLLALGTAFTKTNEQTKQLTLAAMNMAASLGISAETAVRQLGGTLSGSIGLLGKFIPELKGMSEEALKSGKALDIVNAKFGGAAAAQANTFSGKIAQIKNAFGDLGEEVGFFFTKSKTLLFIFETVKKTIVELGSRIGLFRESIGDIWAPIIRGTLTFIQYLTIPLVGALDIVNNIFTKITQTILGAADAMYKFINGDFKGALETGKETMSNLFNVGDLFNLQGTQAAVGWLEGVKETIAANAGVITENLPEEMRGGPQLAPKEEEVAKTQELLDIMGAAYEGFFNRVKISQENTAKLYQTRNKQMFQTMVNGVQGAMNAVGNALVNGGNAFEAFGKQMLAMFGQLATQLGMFYFLLGLATIYESPAQGAGMIAGGLALMVFGGVLQALAGGGGGGASAGAGGGGGGGATGTSGTVGDTTVAQNQQEERQRETNIEVIVQGNVVGDKREFGLMVADSINEAFGNDGLIIARGAIS